MIIWLEVMSVLSFFRKKKTYLGWSEYKRRIVFLDTFAWQQNVRKQSLKNI